MHYCQYSFFSFIINGLKEKTGDYLLNSFDSYFTTYAQINDTKSEKDNSVDKWLMPRALHMSLLNAFKFKATLPGDTSLNVGDVVNFEFPKFVAPDQSGKEPDEYRIIGPLLENEETDEPSSIIAPA